MSKDNIYNGWYNYATYRVNLEIFDGLDDEGGPYTWQMCKDYVEEILETQCENNNSLVFSYALAFINDVSWKEIADHLNESLDDDALAKAEDYNYYDSVAIEKLEGWGEEEE